jgi:hypothetical protein
MDLKQQAQVLVDQAPQDGTTPTLVNVVTPVLIEVANQLQHRLYYVLQAADGRWLTTTLSNRHRPEVEKSVIYAFHTLQDAQSNPQIYQGLKGSAVQMPVLHLLFQVFAIPTLDSVIFFEGGPGAGVEINCPELQQLVQRQVEAYESQRTHARPIPPDLC